MAPLLAAVALCAPLCSRADEPVTSASAPAPSPPLGQVQESLAPILPEAEQKALFALIARQVTALQGKDLTAVMATIHSESPLRDPTQALIEKAKDTYELVYTVSDLKVEMATPDEVWIAFSQLTERKSGPQFRNNRVKGLHTFKKEQGQWKFFDSKVVDVEYFDK